MKLNLTTNCTEHTVLKEYLEENASASLAEKINHGVFIEKDGKRLLNRKDLNGFMKYACEEARKLVDKDAKSACMKSDIVFGWAIHYFEEDAIIGKLYNEDGSEYTPPKPEYKPIQRVPATSISSKPPIKSNAPAQFTLFDLLNKTEEQKEEIVEDSEIVEESEHEEELNEMNVDLETGEILSTKPSKQSTSPIYRRYLEIQEQYPDYAIAYRLGDFYEIFGDNAIKISNELDLTLTGRDCGLEDRVPMIGFPYHASDAYFDKISKRNLLVIVDGEDVTIYSPKKEEPTVETVKDDEPDILEEELALMKSFDKEALCILYELFDGKLNIQ
jgi:hypothetical protein